MSDVRALFISTSNAGVGYWRVWSWVLAAQRNKAMFAHAPWYEKGLNETHPWEVDVMDPYYKHRILDELNDHAKKANVVVMQMAHTPAALNMFLSLKETYKIPVVAEIDDNMISTADYNPANPFYSQGEDFRKIAIDQFKAADAMIVSTPYLREVYSEFCYYIEVVPNAIDFKVWDNLKRRDTKGQVRIGWAGGASHNEDLKLIEPAMRNILAKYKNVRFVFVHGIPNFLKNIDGVECIQRFERIDRYPQYLASRRLDIGLAPLVDNAFNRGKSNLRWLEYSALKVPTVASNVGHFKQTIKDHYDGLLVEPDEWESALVELIENEDRRRWIGKHAYRRVRTDFNIDKEVFYYAKVLKEIVDRGLTKKIEEADYYAPLGVVPAGEELQEGLTV